MRAPALRLGFTSVVAALALACCGGDDDPADGGDTATPADTAEGDAEPGDTDPGETSTTTLPACSGPAAVAVLAAGASAPQVIAHAGGDLAIRGYASACGDGSATRVIVRSACGGGVTALLEWEDQASDLDLALAAPEVGGGLALTSALEGYGELVNTALTTLRDADGSGDFDLEITVTCASGDPTAFTLVLDTTSTAPVPAAANGWPADLLPAGYPGCDGGANFPGVSGLFDQYGHTDLGYGQLYGDMVLVLRGTTSSATLAEHAALARSLHDTVEDLSGAWGFTILTLLGTDLATGPARPGDAAAMAAARLLPGPVAVGPDVAAIDACLGLTGDDLVAIVDPLGQVRYRASAIEAEDVLTDRVSAEYDAFRLDHPTWVSPRCAGVVGDAALCPCAEPARLLGGADADGDLVVDACDRCAAGDDRRDFDRDGAADACEAEPVAPPAAALNRIQSVRAFISFWYDGESATGGWREADGTARRPTMTYVITQRFASCWLQVAADAFTVTPAAELGEDVLLAWRAEAGAVIFDGCEAMGLRLQGEALAEAVASVPWRGAILDRCHDVGCAGRTDPIWDTCEATGAGCGGKMGATLGFGDQPLWRGPSGEAAGFVMAEATSGEGHTLTGEALDLVSAGRDLPAGFYRVEELFLPIEEATRSGAFGAAAGAPCERDADCDGQSCFYGYEPDLALLVRECRAYTAPTCGQADAVDAGGSSHSPGTAKPFEDLATDGVATGVLCADDVDVYALDVAAGEEVHVELTVPTPPRLYGVIVLVYGPGGFASGFVSSDTVTGNADARVTAPAAGTYHVVVLPARLGGLLPSDELGYALAVTRTPP